MLMCCYCLSVAAQTVKADAPGKLPDGSWIITIGDDPFKCLSADQVRGVHKAQIERDSLTIQVSNLSGQINTLKEALASKEREIDLLGREIQLERGMRFNAEQQLVQANKLLEQAAKRHGKLGKFFEHPLAQIAFHIVLPLAVAKLGN